MGGVSSTRNKPIDHFLFGLPFGTFEYIERGLHQILQKMNPYNN